MVKGLDKFREYFREFTGQYVLIGGAACDISFHDQGENFRATRDLNIVLYGASLIFSTHSPELLDGFNRNDCIYITRKRDGITVENLSSIIKRNDIKKSDAYQSGFLEGIVPIYESYMGLRNEIQRSMKQEG